MEDAVSLHGQGSGASPSLIAAMIVQGDYLHAVLHLAWSLDLTTKVRTLVFGWIELLPSEVPPPEDDYDPMAGFKLPGGSRRLYVRHAVVPADDAIAWYEGARRGLAWLPRDEGGLPVLVAQKQKWLDVGPFDEDVVWPHLMCLNEHAAVAPFLPWDLGCVRAHQLLHVSGSAVQSTWSSDGEGVAAFEFLRDRLHFDLAEWPELLGSLHLIAPNPVAREIAVRRVPVADGESFADSVAVKVECRPGFSAVGLEMAFEEVRPWGLVEAHRIDLSSGTALLKFDHRLGPHRAFVEDEQRGILDASPDTVFCDAINIGFSIMQPRRVQAASGERRHRLGRDEVTEEAFHVNVTGDEEVTEIGRTLPRSAREGLHRLQERSSERHALRIERWFDGSIGDFVAARDLLRGLISGVRKRLWIVDPFAGPDELWNHALAVGSRTAPIRILTANDALIQACRHAAFRDQGDAVAAHLQSIGAQGVKNPIAVHVMPGKGDVHDRFLVIDDKVYSLGSSLNEFAQRGTMLIELERAAPVVVGLEKAWERAQPFADWLVARRANRRDLSPETTAAPSRPEVW